jgi:hypothetical protein
MLFLGICSLLTNRIIKLVCNDEVASIHLWAYLVSETTRRFLTVVDVLQNLCGEFKCGSHLSNVSPALHETQTEISIFSKRLITQAITRDAKYASLMFTNYICNIFLYY